ncbi:MAG: DNA-binding protein [Bacteroides sp. SM1_62]|nr:MAG: DNA-binding protein [Bacteroides sp. SM23_62]KPL24768.1 MAG: DNA-binding protein [Bacteroides sp. SM1_62]
MSIPDEVITSKIYLIRGKNVMLDQDLAELYDVETKRLNEQVKRNHNRFPDDFMFQLNNEEFAVLRSQFATSSWGGRRTNPYAFTEHGVLMLSSVLNSDRAIKVNIRIIRIFSKMREILSNHQEILIKIDKIQQQLAEHDNSILLIFEYIKELEQEKQQLTEQMNRKKIGYKRYGD